MDQLADATEMDKQVISAQDTTGQTFHTSPSHSGHEEAFCNAAQPSSDTEAVQDNVPPFLKTPLEIRNQIYRYLLSSKYTKVDFVDEEPEYLPRFSPRATRTYQFHLSILAVNRQINHEANQTLRENLFVKFITDTFVDAEFPGFIRHKLPIVALGCLASRVRYHAMELTLVWDTESLNHPYWIFLFPSDEIVTFCRIFMTSGKFDNPKSSLSIAMTDVAPPMTSILKLLEPFRRLHSIASVKITGKIDAKYKSDLIVRMLRRATDTDAYFQEYQDAMEQGDQAARNNEFPTAIAKYRRALEEGDDFCGVYNTHEVLLESGKYQGQCFDLAFIQIKFALKSKLALIYLHLGNHERAHAWINLAVKDIYHYLHRKERTGRPVDAAHVSVSTIAAQVSEGLKLAERAVEEIEVQLNPGDINLAMKQKRLKTKLEHVKMMLRGETEGFEEIHKVLAFW